VVGVAAAEHGGVGHRAWPAADYTDRAVRSLLSEVVSPPA
jgi:hypothetical protein